MAKKNPFKSKSLQAALDRYIRNDPDQQEGYEEALADYDVARKIYELRSKAGFSQREPARRIGTIASVICPLEDADYQGHSLLMLRRIPAALGKRVEIRFVSVRRNAQPA